MKYLPERMELDNYSKPFLNKGILFEHLVRDLLTKMYPGKEFWFTPITGDDGRDIESNDNILGVRVKEWVECKNLNHNLCLSDIANTMFFAYLNNPAVLIIFSYTELADNFKKEIAEFANKSNIKIQYFAGAKIEELVLKYKDTLPLTTYFPNRDFTNIALPSAEENTTACRAIVVSNPLATEDLPATSSLNFQSFIYIKVYVENNYNVERRYTVKLSDEYKKFFSIMDKVLDKSLQADVIVQPHSVNFVIITLRLNTVMAELSLPQIQVVDNKYFYDVFKSPRIIKTRWVCESPLVGNAYLGFIDSLRPKLEARDVKFIALAGNSGVGKSRLLKELEAETIKHKFRPLTLNLENNISSLKAVCDSILYTFEGLPIIKQDINIEQPSVISTRKKCALQIYKKNFLHAKNLDVIAEYICALLIEERCVLSVDNLQNADESVVNLMVKLLDKLNGIKTTGIVICTFNNDAIKDNTPIKKLQHSIERIGEQDKSVIYHSLFGLKNEEKESEVYVFLRNILSVKIDAESTEFSATIKYLSEKCENIPFYLVETVKYLYEMDVLQNAGSKLYIADWNRFATEIENIPKAVDDIIHRRINSFLENNPEINEEEFTRLIKLINLTQKVPEKIYYKLGFTQKLLDKAIAYNFVARSNCCVVFYHRLIGAYCQRYSYCDVVFLKEFVAAVECLDLQRELFYSYYKAKHYLGSVDRELNRQAMQADVDLVEIAQLQDFAIDVISYTLKHGADYTPKELLQFFLHICSVVSSHLGQAIGEKCISTVYNYIKYNYARFIDDEDLPKFIYKVICVYMDLYNLPRAMEVCAEFEQVYKNSRLSKTTVMLLDSMIAERKFEMNLKVHQSKSAESNIEEAYEKAVSGGSTVQKLKALFGKGKLKYYQLDEECADIWRCAYEAYNRELDSKFDLNNYTHRDKQIIANVNGLVSDMIRNEDYEVKKNNLLNWLNQTGMPYHEIKIRLALAAECLYSNNPQKARELMEEAKLKCMLYNYEGMFPKCFYITAMSYYKEQNWHECLINMHLVVKAYLKLGIKVIASRQPSFYFNMIECVKRGGLGLSEELIRDLKDVDGEIVVRCVKKGMGYNFNLSKNTFFTEIPLI